MAGDGSDAGVLHETTSAFSKEMKKVQYAQDNILQNYKIYIPERSPETVQGEQYWIIYIHGGYFRDPKVDAASLRPALELLTAEEHRLTESGSLATVPESRAPSIASSSNSLAGASDLVSKHVAGYASINYRLAPHTGYPQSEDTENYVKRVAEFPQQLEDVHAAIRHLQTRHDFNNNYILAGHSVGAMLALLAALKATKGQIDPPLCVVGLNGIYDFPHIHETNPEYESMTKNTMRPDQYDEASPAMYQLSEFTSILPKQTLRILLSHSRDDGLVNWDQLERMYETLTQSSPADQPRLDVEIIETKGQHDTIWKEGKELSRSLVKALQMVTSY